MLSHAWMTQDGPRDTHQRSSSAGPRKRAGESNGGGKGGEIPKPCAGPSQYRARGVSVIIAARGRPIIEEPRLKQRLQGVRMGPDE